jgi:hypothetical protein
MGAVRFPMAQMPIPNFGFQGLQRADKAARETTPGPRGDDVEPGSSSTGGLTVNDWGSYSLSSMDLRASSLQAQISDGGAQASLQSTQLELNANAMTLRSEDGLIEFSMSSLTIRASQLSFSFAQEQRAQRVSEFAQSMEGLAGRLEPPSTSRLAVSAQALSLRFSQSAVVSETALNGFEKGATVFSKQSSTLFTKFLVLFRTLLESSDEEATEFLEALNEFLEMFGFATGEDGYEPVDVEAVLNSALPQEAAAVQGENGASVQAFFEQIEIRYTRVEVSMESGVPQESDPIVLDLDGDGVELTDAANAQRFDVFGSGTPALVPFPTAGDAFLAIDRNANGAIDSGRELFGDQHGAAHGFAELAKYDQNLDGMIDVQDAIFEQLLLFGDLDADGDVRPHEFVSLRRAGISAIDLRYDEVARQLSGGNRVAQSSRFIRNDGSTGEAADVVLRTFSTLA